MVVDIVVMLRFCHKKTSSEDEVFSIILMGVYSPSVTHYSRADWCKNIAVCDENMILV